MYQIQGDIVHTSTSYNPRFQAQNVLEQRDNLINMYALAPDIADMMASVYQTTSSISTTTQVLPDPEVHFYMYYCLFTYTSRSVVF